MRDKFKAEADPYFQGPFMRRFPGEELDGNAILYASTYILIKDRMIGLEAQDYLHIENLYYQSMIQRGMISRGPHKQGDPQSHDDYVGLAAASFVVDGAAAKDFAYFGFANGWQWGDTLSSYYGRHTGFIAHIKACAGAKPSLIEQILWSVDILWTACREHETSVSGKILDWIKVQVMKEKPHIITKIAIHFWEKKIRKDYPNLMGDVFACYFERATPSGGTYHARHLFTRWMQGIL